MSRIPSAAHPVLDFLLIQFNVKNDAALGRLLGFDAPYMSKVRHGVLVRTPALALAVHEVFGISFADLRNLSADFVGVEAPVQYAGEN